MSPNLFSLILPMSLLIAALRATVYSYDSSSYHPCALCGGFHVALSLRGTDPNTVATTVASH